MEQKFDARNEPLPRKIFSKEEQEFISKAKVQVPKEYKHKYQDLILNHQNVFSKNDQDIGKAEYFEHNILLKDNKPLFQKTISNPRYTQTRGRSTNPTLA
jgi:16S rRNA G1207 methylase RsmC